MERPSNSLKSTLFPLNSPKMSARDKLGISLDKFLRDCDHECETEFYSTKLAVLKELKGRIGKLNKTQTFNSRTVKTLQGNTFRNQETLTHETPQESVSLILREICCSMLKRSQCGGLEDTVETESVEGTRNRQSFKKVKRYEG